MRLSDALRAGAITGILSAAMGCEEAPRAISAADPAANAETRRAAVGAEPDTGPALRPRADAKPKAVAVPSAPGKPAPMDDRQQRPAAAAPVVASGAATIDESGARLCAPGDPKPIVPRWHVGRLAYEGDPEPFACSERNRQCYLTSIELATAGDGSLWVAGAVRQAPRQDSDLGVWVAHHDVEGQRLSGRLVETDQALGNVYSYRIAADARGHAFLAVTVTDPSGMPARTASGPSRFMEEYGPDGERVGERMTVDGEPTAEVPLLAATGADGLAIGTNTGPGVALMESDRSLRWEQPRTGSAGVYHLVGDELGRVSVLAYSGGRDPEPDIYDLSIEQYAADGQLVHESVFDRTLRFPTLGHDYDGNLIATDYVGGASGGPLELWVHKIDPAGTLLWLTRVPVPAGFGDASELGRFGRVPPRAIVGDGQGTLFMQGGVTQLGDELNVNIYEVAADGASCVVHQLHFTEDGYNELELLAVNRDGQLFFAAGRAYGRFERN